MTALGLRRSAPWQAAYDRDLAGARAGADPAAWEAAWAAGAAWSLEQAISAALDPHTIPGGADR